MLRCRLPLLCGDAKLIATHHPTHHSLCIANTGIVYLVYRALAYLVSVLLGVPTVAALLASLRGSLGL